MAATYSVYMVETSRVEGMVLSLHRLPPRLIRETLDEPAGR
jgi:hypothetical protein